MSPALAIIAAFLLLSLVLGVLARRGRTMTLEQWSVGGRGFGTIFVFLLMGMLFESVVLPLAVIIAVPFSFLGVYWTLYLTRTPFDPMAMIGAGLASGSGSAFASEKYSFARWS